MSTRDGGGYFLDVDTWPQIQAYEGDVLHVDATYTLRGSQWVLRHRSVWKAKKVAPGNQEAEPERVGTMWWKPWTWRQSRNDG